MTKGHPQSSAGLPAGLPLTVIATALFIHTLWGANPVAVKFGLIAFPPWTSALLRFVIALVCVGIWAKMNGYRLTPQRHEWRGLGMLALLFVVQIISMNVGYGLSTGAMGAVLLATYPLFAAVFSRMILPSERLHTQRIAGLLLAFSGAVVVLLKDIDLTAVDGVTFGTFGNWVVIFSAMLLGLRMAFSAKLVREIDTVRVNFWQMGLSLPIFAAGAVQFETVDLAAVSWLPVLGILYQGVVIAGFCFTVNFALMKSYPPAVMISFGFVAPISGVLLSWWLLAESLSWSVLVGSILVGLGLVFISRNPPSGKKNTAAHQRG